MRISDWSSDMCSSDLWIQQQRPAERSQWLRSDLLPGRERQPQLYTLLRWHLGRDAAHRRYRRLGAERKSGADEADRKSGGEGKSGGGREEKGGGRKNKKKKRKTNKNKIHKEK